MPIQKQTIKIVTVSTPFLINLFFHIILIVPPLAVFAIYEAVDAKTTTSIQTCRIEWEDGFFKEIQPSPCTRYFPLFTRQIIRDMERNERFYALPSNK